MPTIRVLTWKERRGGSLRGYVLATPEELGEVFGAQPEFDPGAEQEKGYSHSLYAEVNGVQFEIYNRWDGVRPNHAIEWHVGSWQEASVLSQVFEKLNLRFNPAFTPTSRVW